MALTPSQKQIVRKEFDAFIKTCLRNELRDIEKFQKSIKENEVTRADVNLLVIDIHSDEISLPDFVVEGLPISIENDDLLRALKKLKEKERVLVLLIHFLGYKPREVAQKYEVCEKTVYNWNKKIIDFLRKTMEDKT